MTNKNDTNVLPTAEELKLQQIIAAALAAQKEQTDRELLTLHRQLQEARNGKSEIADKLFNGIPTFDGERNLGALVNFLRKVEGDLEDVALELVAEGVALDLTNKLHVAAKLYADAKDRAFEAATTDDAIKLAAHHEALSRDLGEDFTSSASVVDTRMDGGVQGRRERASETCQKQAWSPRGVSGRRAIHSPKRGKSYSHGFQHYVNCAEDLLRCFRTLPLWSRTFPF